MKKEGSFLVKSIFLQPTTTVTWNYQPEHHPGVLRLWITSVEQTSLEKVEQHSSVLEQSITNRQEESKEQSLQLSNQYIDNKSNILKQVFKLLDSDEFVNTSLTYATVTLIFLAILGPLLTFRDKLAQGQRTSLTSTTSEQS